MKKICVFILIIFQGFNSLAQTTFKTLKVVDFETGDALGNVSITKMRKVIGQTNSLGLFRGNINIYDTLMLTSTGYLSLNYISDKDSFAIIKMQSVKGNLEEVIIISSTRNNQRIENSPLKVEVLGREEMDEENSIKPGNIASILGDVSGVQIQQTSVTSGNSTVRIQGLSGQYTQILKDGIPLFEGFNGGFGVLSIPPLDLKQIELIKGSASTLYGGGAIGGLINIISRKPSTKQDVTLTVNASTLNEKNVNVYVAKKFKKIGYTFFGGYTNQQPVDVNKDTFTDVAKLKAIILHPKIFIYPSQKVTIAVGNNTIIEDRNGGDISVVKNKAFGNHVYFEQNKSLRNTSDINLSAVLNNNKKFEFKSSYSYFDRAINTNTHRFRAVQNNFFNEASIVIPYKKNNIVGGINFLAENFTKKSVQYTPVNNFNNSTVGFFIQNTINVNEKTVVEVGLRNDITKHYGNFILPRIAFITHLNENWGIRAGIGFGYKTPNALNNTITDVPIETILPIATNVTAEKSIGYNIEANYKYEWDNNKKEVFLNHAFFLTNITNPVVNKFDRTGFTFFRNEDKSISTKGFDTYVKLKLDELELYAGFTYTQALRNYETIFKPVLYTPKTRAAFTAIQEFDGGWRIGAEGSYNGFQYRDDRTKTPDYLFLAGLVEKKFLKHFTAVLNCENILDYRQSKIESLYSGDIAHPIFESLWAPIDGRVLNLSLKYML